MKEYAKVVETVEHIIEPIGFENYLENFSNPQDEEIKKFLVEYADALDKTNNSIKGNVLKERINSYFQ